MQGIDLSGAIKYNKKKAGKIWNQEDLPWPLSMVQPPFGFFLKADSQAFAFVVATFQQLNGLKPDGMLGPATFAAMNAAEPVLKENDAGHDFESESGTIALPPEPELSTKPARRGVSNRIIIAGRAIKLPDSMIERGITASNYKDDDEHQFTQFRKRERVSVFVIHESVTMSVAQTNRVLDNKRKRSAKKGKNKGKGWDYGIHLNLAPDGHISCHADLVHHRLVQANHMNDDSFGLEVVNPYNPGFAGAPFNRVIDGPWWCWRPKNRKRLYTLPTPAQMRAIYPLCEFLVQNIEGLPLEFPTAHLGPRKKRIDGWKDGAKTGPGIVAHRDFATHADGRYLLEHCIEQSNLPIHERG
jgi:hypothetical protein